MCSVPAPAGKRRGAAQAALRAWFGSCARGEETPDSDIDFIVEFHGASAFDHMRLELEWSEYLKKPVDVVSMGTLGHDYFADQVRKEMVLL